MEPGLWKNGGKFTLRGKQPWTMEYLNRPRLVQPPFFTAPSRAEPGRGRAVRDKEWRW